MTQHSDILLVTKGHPFDRAAFFGLFDALPDVGWTHVEHPAAEALFAPDEARRFDAFVCYDMPGIRFHPDRAPDFPEPDPLLKARLQTLVDEGFGFVFLHHAIAGWPAWEGYAELLGGRFLYMPGTLRGVARQDSGYRHSVTHTVRVLRDHPVTIGVPASFEMTDELYLYEVFDDSVEPLLASDHAFTSENFYSAARVVRDQKMFDNEGWAHASGSNLIGWTRTVGNSRIVYLQCGDDPVAYANPHFQRLLTNAIHWVSHRD
ncbi:MAG: ThuA domain-containing protein [Pseudomonadales bacterium]